MLAVSAIQKMFSTKLDLFTKRNKISEMAETSLNKYSGKTRIYSPRLLFYFYFLFFLHYYYYIHLSNNSSLGVAPDFFFLSLFFEPISLIQNNNNFKVQGISH